jgi:hypothetical protein
MPHPKVSGQDDPPLPSFGDLVSTYTLDPDDPPITDIVSLADALTTGDAPWHIVSYLEDLGMPVHQLSDLLSINTDDEEELHAWPCREGVAVSVASDSAWVLYIP